MITVLHLINSLDTGGAEMMLYKFLSHSDRSRFRHVVVSLVEVGPVGPRIEALSVPVYTLGVQPGVPDPRVVDRFLKLLRRVEPNVMETYLYHANLLGLLGAKVVRVPIVWSVFSSFHPYLGWPGKLSGRLSGLPEVVLTDSDASREWHTSLGYRPKEWQVIPNGFELEKFAPDESARQAVRRELRLPDDAVLIGLVARFHPMKDHQTFLRAAGMLGQRNQEVHFVLIGREITADNRALQEAIQTNQLRDRVHLLGERADIPRLTAALDIATSSSRYGESFPNVVGEAMACAVPCVVTDIGGTAGMIGDTGMVVPPGDARALAAALQELVDLGPEGRQELGRCARSRVEECFSLDSVVRQYEALYERLASKQVR